MWQSNAAEPADLRQEIAQCRRQGKMHDAYNTDDTDSISRTAGNY